MAELMIDKRWLTVGALAVGVVSLGANEVAQADEADGVWIARTADQIKEDIQQEDNYQIKWGDTLWSLSEATGVSMERLAEINDIEDVNLIQSGGSMSFTGKKEGNEDNRKIVVKDEKGKVQVVANANPKKEVIDEEATMRQQNLEKALSNKKVTNDGKTQIKNGETLVSKTKSSEGSISDLGQSKPSNDNLPTHSDKKLNISEDYSMTVKYIDNFNNVLKEETVVGNDGDKLTINKAYLEGYTYVKGADTVEFNAQNNNKIFYVNYQKDSVKYKFTLRYEFDDAKTKESTIEVESGHDFDIKAKQFDGYQLVSDDNVKVTSNGDKTITFKYKKVEQKSVKLTIRYLFDDGSEQKSVKTVKKGESYKIVAKDFEGYTLIGDRTQTVQLTSNKTITYRYKKASEQKVKLVKVYKFNDGSPNKVETEQVVSGNEYKINAKEFLGYKVTGKSSYDLKITQDTRVEFNYEKTERKKYNLTITYKFDDKASIVDSKLIEDGTAYNVSAKQFDGYELVSTPSITFFANQDESVTFEYKKVKAKQVSLKINRVFDDGKETITTTQKYDKGTKLNVLADKYAGYSLVSQDNLTFTLNNNKVITFKYKKTAEDSVKYEFKVNYIDEHNKLLKTKNFEGELGEVIKIAEEIPGYKKVDGLDKVTVTKGMNNKTLYVRYANAQLLQSRLRIKYNFSDKETITEARDVDKGQELTINAKEFDGYTLVGNPSVKVDTNEDAIVEFNYMKNYSVNVVYKDTAGNILGKTALKGYEGQKRIIPFQDIKGYECLEDKQKTLIFSEATDGTNIDVLYKKVAVENKVKVQLKLEDGSLYKAEEFKVDDGEEFTYTAPSINGYTLQGSNSIKEKIYDDKTYTFTYTKNKAKVFNVKVNYMFDGKAPESENFKMEEGSTFKVDVKNFEGYNLNSIDSEKEFTVTGDKQVTLRYVKKDVKVKVKYKFDDGKTQEDVKTYKYGDAVSIKALNFEGYTLTGDSTKNFVAKNDTEVVFTYSKIAKNYTITVNSKFNDGKETVKNYVNIKEGETLKLTAPTYSGYEVSGSNTQTVKGDSNKTITFTYNKKEEYVPLTIKYNYSDKASTSITKSLVKGKTYTIDAPTMSGYKISGNSSIKVTMTGKKTIEFNYEKEKAQTDKVIMKAVCDGQVVKTVTKEIKVGERFTPSTMALGLDAKEYDLSIVTIKDDIVGVGGKTYNYTFNVKKLTNGLNATEIKKANATIFKLVNELRLEYGLKPLVSNDILDQASAVRAKETSVLFDHIRPDGRSVSTAIKDLGYSPGLIGENIAKNYFGLTDGVQAGTALFQSWKASPSHLSMMLSTGMNQIGIGVYSEGNVIYGAQLFSTGVSKK